MKKWGATPERPHAIVVTTAAVIDRKGALQAMGRGKSSLDEMHSARADSDSVRVILDEAVMVAIAKRSELATFAVIPKR